MSFRSTVLALSALLFTTNFAVQAQRLPGGLRPEHYSLTLTPDLRAATFSGEETIDVILDAPSHSVTLNAAEIKFLSVELIDPRRSKTSPPVLDTAKVSLDPEKEQATFTFANELPAGKVSLAIKYTGILNDKLRGFYLSKTKTRNYAVTQFEPTDARRAYPSFDEPALKATYDVALVVDAADTAISNTNIISDTPGPVAGKHTLRFATTPKMSTYLVAFLVGDFKCTEGKSDGVPIRLAFGALEVADKKRNQIRRHLRRRRETQRMLSCNRARRIRDDVRVGDGRVGSIDDEGNIVGRLQRRLIEARISAARIRRFELRHRIVARLCLRKIKPAQFVVENARVLDRQRDLACRQFVGEGKGGLLLLRIKRYLFRVHNRRRCFAAARIDQLHGEELYLGRIQRDAMARRIQDHADRLLAAERRGAKIRSQSKAVVLRTQAARKPLGLNCKVCSEEKG